MQIQLNKYLKILKKKLYEFFFFKNILYLKHQKTGYIYIYNNKNNSIKKFYKNLFLNKLNKKILINYYNIAQKYYFNNIFVQYYNNLLIFFYLIYLKINSYKIFLLNYNDNYYYNKKSMFLFKKLYINNINKKNIFISLKRNLILNLIIKFFKNKLNSIQINYNIILK